MKDYFRGTEGLVNLKEPEITGGRIFNIHEPEERITEMGKTKDSIKYIANRDPDKKEYRIVTVEK